MRIFTKLAKPEKMAWMFDYRIDGDAPSPPPWRPPGHPGWLRNVQRQCLCNAGEALLPFDLNAHADSR